MNKPPCFDNERCLVPPLGWSCSRPAGHAGPCAAISTPRSPKPESSGAVVGMVLASVVTSLFWVVVIFALRLY